MTIKSLKAHKKQNNQQLKSRALQQPKLQAILKLQVEKVLQQQQVVQNRQ